jgi:hypothetical protein
VGQVDLVCGIDFSKNLLFNGGESLVDFPLFFKDTVLGISSYLETLRDSETIPSIVDDSGKPLLHCDPLYKAIVPIASFSEM